MNFKEREKRYIVFSLRLRNFLETKGFYPIIERENRKNNYYKIWIFRCTPDFKSCLEEWKQVSK